VTNNILQTLRVLHVSSPNLRQYVFVLRPASCALRLRSSKREISTLTAKWALCVNSPNLRQHVSVRRPASGVRRLRSSKLEIVLRPASCVLRLRSSKREIVLRPASCLLRLRSSNSVRGDRVRYNQDAVPALTLPTTRDAGRRTQDAGRFYTFSSVPTLHVCEIRDAGRAGASARKGMYVQA